MCLGYLRSSKEPVWLEQRAGGREGVRYESKQDQVAKRTPPFILRK